MFSHHCPLTQPVVLKIFYSDFKMRYFIYLAYDGTNYHGWQIQPNGMSVQEALMRALSTFLRKKDRGGGSRTYGCRCACPAYGGAF